jgi:hypothetical protein
MYIQYTQLSLFYYIFTLVIDFARENTQSSLAKSVLSWVMKSFQEESKIIIFSSLGESNKPLFIHEGKQQNKSYKMNNFCL